ncbi:MAG TPA: ABC transporter permease subunit [Bacteroidales bacterium]|nr:ABC transporter permease subunit [Bacteroidales bacterium]
MNKNILFVLLKNEIAEQFRSRKFIVVLVVFVVFAIMSPITALFMPDIISSVSESQNIKIEVPPPTWIDAVVQYVKNMTQIISFVLIIVYMGIIAREKENGILVFLLVKPVKRTAIIVSKYLSVLFVAIAGITVSFIVSGFYTFLFFEGFVIKDFLLQNLFILINIISTLFIVVLFSSIFKSQIVAGILSFVAYLLISLTSQVEKISEFLPSGLITQCNNMMKGTEISFMPILGTLVFMSICVVLSIISFSKWEA